MEFHIVYSPAFSVTVLYFRIFRASTGEILWQLNETDVVKKGLTQMPHPYFQTPFWQLHPCHTTKWMEKLLNKADEDKTNYIVAWLSFIAPNVQGLVISEKYAMHPHDK